MSGFTSGFPSLPQAGGIGEDDIAAEQAAKIAAFENSTGPGRSPVDASATISRINQLNREDSIRSAGMFVSGLGLKATEGMSALANKFSTSIPFFKPAALTQTFSQLSNPSALLDSLKTKVGAAFGLGGLVKPPSVSGLTSALSPQVSASEVKAIAGQDGANGINDHQVSLTGIIDQYPVVFRVMPEITENRSVDYEAVAPAQAPGSFQKYKGTQSTQWQVNATFIARTSAEATQNLKDLNVLRSWCMPFYGENTAIAYPGRLGAPPEVLKFKGLRKGIIGEVPVVITSLSWSWPKDVDYIPAESPDGLDKNIPFPTVMQVAIQLVESFSTTQFTMFDLAQFRLGNMVDAYKSNSKATGNSSTSGARPPPTIEAQSDNDAGPGSGMGSGPEVVEGDASELKTAQGVPNSYRRPSSNISTKSTAGDGNIEDLGLG